jgi:hypothetical protein
MHDAVWRSLARDALHERDALHDEAQRSHTI